MPSSTTLEQFRTKHGQQAYNALIKAVEDSGRKPPVPDNRALSSFGLKMLSKPTNTAKLSAQTIHRIRGSADVPLNAEGLQQADTLGRQFASKGGLDAILSDNLQRGLHTAVAIARHTGAPLQANLKQLQAWRSGIFEGQPVDNVVDMLAKLANDHPNDKVPGRSPVSTENGESFNDFKDRWFNQFLIPLMQAHAQQPTSKVGVVTHLRNSRSTEKWVENGSPQDLSFKHQDIMKRAAGGEEPAGVKRLFPDGDKWKIEDVKMDKPEEQLDHGIYLIRHGSTDWNGSTSGEGTS